jgi:hypothetical protein
MEFSDWMLLVITIVVVAGAVVLGRLAASARGALDSLRRTLDRVGQLLPAVEATLVEVQGEVRELHAVTARVNGIATDLEMVVHEVQRVVLGLLSFTNASTVTQRVRAAAVGARAGVAMLKSAVAGR